jgi:hypothetical protein
MNYIISVGYNQDVRRYYVEASDIPGLNVEAENFEAFVETVQDVAADLLGDLASGSKISIQREVVLAA